MIRSERRDRAWAALAVWMAVCLACSLIATCWQILVRGNWAALLQLPITGALCWWWGIGAWRRTRWSRPATTPTGSAIR